MPSLISRLKKKKQDVAPVEAIAPVNGEKPPVFKLYRQGTSDAEPEPITPVDEEFRELQLTEKITPETAPLSSGRSPSISFKNETGNTTPRKAGNGEVTPPSRATLERRLSRRLLGSLSRRPSMASNRSRSSSYVPDFQPIDRNADVEAQWEHRATMLARAGPPSPAIPRTDSIFDTGPPKLPPLDVGTTPSMSTASKDAAAELPGLTVKKPPMSRNPSSKSRLDPDLATATIAEDGPVEQDAGNQSRDEFLQAAIREHENGNLEISAHLFKKAAQGDEGLPMGQLMYGLSLRHGWGVQRDEARAIHWLRLAATSSAAVEETALRAGIAGGGQMKGDLILAIFELGNCFRHGWGIDMDKELARNYYETAANLGDSDAMFEVAWCYETGFGIKKDKFKAAYWYRKSELAGSKVPGMQWIWKPKYEYDPFVHSAKDRKRLSTIKKAG